MKTADIIPLILLELNNADKYGLELSKNIEEKSNGQIVIKQPTLYTILKKLEKSKFITSYWLDSEIGGKRHYYKITDNGRAQVATLPSYQELVTLALADDSNNEETEPKANVIEPIVSTLPSEEVFAETNIDTITNQENNENNLKVLNEEPETNFAENTEVSKFIDNTPKQDVSIRESKEKNDILDLSNYSPSIRTSHQDIKFTEYVNLKKDKKHLSSKAYCRCRIFTSLFVACYLLAIVVFTLIGYKDPTTKLMGIFMILATITAILYPSITLAMRTKIRQNAISHLNRHSTLANIYLSIIVLILGFIGLEIYNLFGLGITFVDMFQASNYPNFYLELILLLSVILNCVVYSTLKYRIRKTYDTNS